MYDKTVIKNYARLVLKFGVNLQKGQGLEIACSTENASVAEIFVKEAYELGAKIVSMRWTNQRIQAINYEKGELSELTNIPKWFIDSKNFLLKENYCYIAIDDDDPFAFNSVSAEKLSKIATARSKALKNFSNSVMNNGIRWCVVSLPSKNWAKKVFPNTKNPKKLLFNEIAKCTYLLEKDPIKKWEEHVRTLNEHATALNHYNFEYLHFKNGLGTNLKVGLANEHVWLSAKEKSVDGIEFIANMPTEEVFTAPHKLKTNGVVKSAMPLSFNGQIIEDFTLTFKDGKIVKATAKRGDGILKGLLSIDKGCKYIGEVALIGKNSPIAKSGILFYNTLFDENASCHLAIGKAYPTTVKNGEKLSVKELKELGANDSVEHVDFMIGTPDLDVIGITHDGKEIPVFVSGDWVI